MKLGLLPTTAGVIVGVFAVVALAQAVTTISTDITTGGALSVTGLTTLGNASSTILSAYTAYFGGSATTTISSTGAVSILGTLNVTGLTTLGNASSTILSAGFAEFGSTGTTTITTAGWIGVASTSPTTALGVTGTTTSSTGMRIGALGSGITMMQFGTCAVDFPSTNASTTSVANCTANGVSTLDRVFITPQNVPNQFVVTGASSTAAGNVIQISGFNLGTQGGAGSAVDPASATYSWMAVR